MCSSVDCSEVLILGVYKKGERGRRVERECLNEASIHLFVVHMEGCPSCPYIESRARAHIER